MFFIYIFLLTTMIRLFIGTTIVIDGMRVSSVLMPTNSQPTYSCQCPLGFSGHDCEINSNDCFPGTQNRIISTRKCRYNGNKLY